MDRVREHDRRLGSRDRSSDILAFKGNQSWCANYNSHWQSSPRTTGTRREQRRSTRPSIVRCSTKWRNFSRRGQPKQALDLLARSKVHAPWSTNAIGVCLLRLGQADRAVELFRNLVLSGSLFLRSDVPAAWMVNFATALLMADNLAGCVRLLAEIQEDHPAVQRLRAALQSWRDRLSVWEKIRWFLGGQPPRRVELEFLPGEL